MWYIHREVFILQTDKSYCTTANEKFKGRTEENLTIPI